MAKLNKDDLEQMSKSYFESLEKQRLVEVATNLHQLAVEQCERLELSSSNSSRPPSTDNPYQTKNKKKEDKDVLLELNNQPGAKGFGRTKPLVIEEIIPHYPDSCASCNHSLTIENNKPYMGYHVLELKPEKSGFKVVCQLHHYYELNCECGHKTKASPGYGYISTIDGRSTNLQLKEYVLVGPMLATFIASLSVRYRMSRAKIKEFLWDWAETKLSLGTIDRCIRETGIACSPVVEKLIEEIQNVEILHLDETHWEVQGDLQGLWVAISGKTAVYHIGSRRKEELLYLVTEAFMGWLVTDGYLSYRSYPKRQRCLAHLIRKAIALTGAVNQKAAQIGKWILNSLKELITGIAEGLDQSSKTISDNLFMLEISCFIGSNKSHDKLKALAKEILNDWDAVMAFVNNPDLPPTNNEAERALRHAVIGRRISYGTRTSEGSLAYSSLLSVIETCRLRNINPWTYICEVIKGARKGLSPPPVPTA